MKETERFYNAVQRVKSHPPSAALQLSWEELVCVVSGLILARTHPEVPDGPKAVLRAVAERLIAQVHAHEAELSAIMQRGFAWKPPR